MASMTAMARVAHPSSTHFCEAVVPRKASAKAHCVWRMVAPVVSTTAMSGQDGPSQAQSWSSPIARSTCEVGTCERRGAGRGAERRHVCKQQSKRAGHIPHSTARSKRVAMSSRGGTGQKRGRRWRSSILQQRGIGEREVGGAHACMLAPRAPAARTTHRRQSARLAAWGRKLRRRPPSSCRRRRGWSWRGKRRRSLRPRRPRAMWSSRAWMSRCPWKP